MENNLLSLIIFAPLVGAAINWFAGRRVRDERFIGLVAGWTWLGMLRPGRLW